MLSRCGHGGTLNNCSHLTELIGGAARETQGQERTVGSSMFSHRCEFGVRGHTGSWGWYLVSLKI